ncbi:MAG: family 10 glycosylhydrolase [Myxococcaceae bacterium]|jgi:uncharacterized lipoprotein YddW (UPF0748 family)|nr:family 10 glycosylhydrolase [Myxococcaceae bacterium]MCA3012528.1 family 10 glycosylhydrolase [Myxococcaceae bacterium]
MRAVICCLCLAVLACGGAPAPVDGGEPPAQDDGGGRLEPDGGVGEDAGRGDDGGRDAGVDGGAPDGGVRLVAVAHQRELRGVWVSTVSNLDVPQLASRDAGVAALAALVERTRSAGLNALFFQVRPESDAWYQSSLEPWSRFLTGTQGRDPGWDPLETLLELAHARGVEVHAWVNPYRGLVSASAQAAATHVSRTLSAHAVTYGGKVTMDPGARAVRAHVVAVMSDLLDRYDVDGLHFDDYFYPYPDGSGAPFPDEATFQAYRADGGVLGKSDWRRDNVNQLVREVMGLVTREHPQVRFGISPFGIWRPNNPPGVVGLDAFETISCDAVTWLNQGWVDYVAPQLYWPTTSTGQPFVPLLTWWAGALRGGRHVYAGHGLYRLGTSGWTSADEIRAQVVAARVLRSEGVLGGIHFREANLRANLLGVADLFKSDLYAAPALPPPLPRAGAAVAPTPPTVARTAGQVSVSHPLPMTVRFFALYRLGPQGQWVLADVAGGPQATFPVRSGTFAVSAVGRGGAESQAAVVVVP